MGLLATAYTMEQEFYVGRLREVHGLGVLVPDRRIVHDELCVGVVDERSREEYRRIMRDIADRGAEGILLGCTEIDLLVSPDDTPVAVFDTTRLHAERAVDLALESVPRAAASAPSPRRPRAEVRLGSDPPRLRTAGPRVPRVD